MEHPVLRWLGAIIEPSLNTYRAIAQNPKANAWRPTVWVILASLVATIIAIRVDYLRHQDTFLPILSNGDPAHSLGMKLLVEVIVSLVGFMTLAGIQHLVAHRRAIAR